MPIENGYCTCLATRDKLGWYCTHCLDKVDTNENIKAIIKMIKAMCTGIELEFKVEVYNIEYGTTEINLDLDKEKH